MAGQQLGKRAIQVLAEDTPPIGAKGGEPPAFLPVFFGVSADAFILHLSENPFSNSSQTRYNRFSACSCRKRDFPLSPPDNCRFGMWKR
jgi:hypothetical protein